MTCTLLQFEADPGKVQLVPIRAGFASANHKEGGSAPKRVVMSSSKELVVSHVEMKDFKKYGLADGESFMLRLPSGVGLGGEAGMLKLPEDILVGHPRINLTLELAPELEGQYSVVPGF